MISLCWTFEELILFGQLHPLTSPPECPEGLVSLHPSQHPGSTLSGSRLCSWSGRMGFSDSQGVSALLGSHMVSWQVMAKSFTASSICESFLPGNLHLGKCHFSENLEVQTHPDSPGYKPSLSSWHGKEKTLRNHLAHIPLMNCQLSCLRAGCLPCAFSWVWLCVAAHTFDSSWETVLWCVCIIAMAWRLHDLVYVVS